jgi:RNA processing factor Prp31
LSLLPFKKKVRINTVGYGDEDGFSMDLYIANVGNEPICIQSVQMKDDNGVVLVYTMDIDTDKNMITPQMAQWYHFDFDNMDQVISLDNNHIRIEIETLKKTYRHKTTWAVG